MKITKPLSLLLSALMLTSALAGCASKEQAKVSAQQQEEVVENVPNNTQKENAPKYVFLFIGDGMTYPQFQTTSAYLGALENEGEILKGSKELDFMQFPIVGSATTYDSTSFCPDSASTATSIATGHKTHSGVLNMDESKTKSFVTIAEKLRDKEYKIGVISSVNLNHATPAAFYAHQPSRNNYYEIGQELIASNFDYFAGGGLKKVTGNDKDKENLYDIAEKSGYKIVMTQSEAELLEPSDGKVIAIAETLADSDSMSYEIDRKENEWALSDYVKKGVELLDNEKGFFMMVEGGKIDWACHANDIGSTIGDTLALNDSVKVAIDFAQKHPDETLILVTGDHETGGLSIGFAGTDYDTYLNNILSQKISYAKFDSDYVEKYKENKTSFDDAMKDVQDLFGLCTADNATPTTKETLILTDYEIEKLKKAYDITLSGGFGTDADGNSLQTEDEYVTYGTYTPFSVTVTHLLNNKSGINFASYSHTGLPAAVFAKGVGEAEFEGYFDNTDIYAKLAKLLNI